MNDFSWRPVSAPKPSKLLSRLTHWNNQRLTVVWFEDLRRAAASGPMQDFREPDKYDDFNASAQRIYP